MLAPFVKLLCGLLFLFYSHEKDDFLPKVWYWQDLLFMKTPMEVRLEMGTDPRVHVTPDHTLVLHNVTSADAGIYHCLEYNFLLDGKPLEVSLPL
jgi:hypothetical protein